MFEFMKSLLSGFITSIIIPNFLSKHSSKIPNPYFLGKWQGFYTQNNIEGNFHFKINLINKGRKIIGVIDEYDDHHKFNCTGYYYDPRIIAMEYRITEAEGIIRFGTIFLQIKSDGTKANGHFVGYGPKNETVVNGPVTLEKVNN